MRASTDFFVVGMTGVGTTLFLIQLLIVSQQIVAAHNHIQAELTAEDTALPISWMAGRPMLVRREKLNFCPQTKVCWPVGHPTTQISPEYPKKALARHVTGFVDFTFTTKPDGSIANPVIETEFPKGYGFAAAAAKVFPQWRFQPDNDVPASVPAIMQYRMAFKLPD